MVIVRKRKASRSGGAAAVEAALVLPILLLVTFGGIRYGWFFLKAQQITNAARCGARTAVLYTTDHSKVIGIISTLLGPYGAKIIEEGENIEDDEGLKVTFWITDNDGNVTQTNNIGGAYAQYKIKVAITVLAADVDILPMGLFKFEPDDWEIGASVTMAKEGWDPVPDE
jgi:Flp pilus assembly protein TadG